MAQAFLNPPGGVASLAEVVRHQGPVLALATKLRQCTSPAKINACWPTRNHTNSDSQIVVHQYPNAWLASAKEVLLDPRWVQNPNSGRILAWSNRAVASITNAIRKARFGDLAAEGWQVGEIVSNGDAIQQPGKSLAPPIAPSTCEWRVAAAEPYQLTLHLADCQWHTPKTKAPREFSIGCDLTVQQLKLEPLVAGDWSRQIEVYAPISGDPAWADQINALRLNIVKIEAGPARTKAWVKWHELRSYCCDLRSAAVLTVHRAQGSTFAGVWLWSDLAWCTSSDAVPLHYTALTRASRAVHVIRRENDQSNHPQ
jgi:exodeoxyribonuclease-5